MPSARHTHAFLIQWLTLLAAVLLAAFSAGFDLYKEHSRIEQGEQERLLAMSRVIQVNVEHNLASVNHVLSDLRNELAAEPVSEKFNERLSALVAAMPSVRTIAVLDAAGRIRASNQPQLLRTGGNFSERDYFKTPQARPDRDVLYVSPPFQTALGAYSIPVARMISGRNGEFGGVIAATLDPTYFGPLLDSVRYAPDMRSALHHGDGVVFVQAGREGNPMVGRNLAQPGSFFLKHKEDGQAQSVFSGTMLASGESRMIALRDVQPAELRMDKSLGVAVSRLLTEIYAPWRHDLAVTSAFLSVISLAFAAWLYVYQRRYRQFLLKEAKATKALAASEWKLKAIIEAEPECVLVLATDRRVMQINPAGLAMIEADSTEAIIGRKWIDLVAAEHRTEFDELNRSVNTGATGKLVFEIVGLKGGRHWLDMHAVPMRDAEALVTGLLGVARDITERRKAMQELTALAQTDALTQLDNRRQFMNLAETELSRTIRYGGTLSILMIDIDHFKSVNDAHGHRSGDLVLQKLAGLFREALRDTDRTGRMGGEEFAVILPQTDGAQALQAAERLRHAVEHAEFVLEHGLPLHVTISIGVATLADRDTNIDILLSQADGALYEAKRAGRNRVCVCKNPLLEVSGHRAA